MLEHSHGLTHYDGPSQKELDSYQIGREEKGFRDIESGVLGGDEVGKVGKV